MVALRLWLRGVMFASAALAIAGCASSSPRRAVSPQSIEAGELRLDALEAQEHPAGRCGLYAWAQTSVRPILALVSFTNPTEARVRINGREQIMPRTAASGESIYGQFETQTFADSGVTITLEVTFDPARQMRDGAAIERGTLRVLDRRGWETIIPIGGMVACVAN